MATPCLWPVEWRSIRARVLACAPRFEREHDRSKNEYHAGDAQTVVTLVKRSADGEHRDHSDKPPDNAVCADRAREW